MPPRWPWEREQRNQEELPNQELPGPFPCFPEDPTATEFFYNVGGGHRLIVNLTHEGVIFDRMDAEGNVLATCAGTFDEIAEGWCH